MMVCQTKSPWKNFAAACRNLTYSPRVPLDFGLSHQTPLSCVLVMGPLGYDEIRQGIDAITVSWYASMDQLSIVRLRVSLISSGADGIFSSDCVAHVEALTIRPWVLVSAIRLQSPALGGRTEFSCAVLHCAQENPTNATKWH